ncbi:hypothetical protein DFH06DRAFT_527834 [Mycena polygramma]|nr:hypothetical protein DFH06DRAFT_527834 [Mycena polygramma]
MRAGNLVDAARWYFLQAFSPTSCPQGASPTDKSSSRNNGFAWTAVCPPQIQYKVEVATQALWAPHVLCTLKGRLSCLPPSLSYHHHRLPSRPAIYPNLTTCNTSVNWTTPKHMSQSQRTKAVRGTTQTGSRAGSTTGTQATRPAEMSTPMLMNANIFDAHIVRDREGKMDGFVNLRYTEDEQRDTTGGVPAANVPDDSSFVPSTPSTSQGTPGTENPLNIPSAFFPGATNGIFAGRGAVFTETKKVDGRVKSTSKRVNNVTIDEEGRAHQTSTKRPHS